MHTAKGTLGHSFREMYKEFEEPRSQPHIARYNMEVSNLRFL